MKLIVFGIFLLKLISAQGLKEKNALPRVSNEGSAHVNIQIVPKEEFLRIELKNVSPSDSRVEIGKRKRITAIMFARTSLENIGVKVCTDTASDFPHFLSESQRRSALLIIPFLIGIYCFTFLAFICNDYFLPSIERICDALNLSQDVAAATFMAIATSAPEFFVNVIGTFVTHSDIGIGTVVGSSMFNTLGVASLGGLAASVPIQLDWWPLTRDCTMYIIAVTVLVIVSWDGKIYWYEALILIAMYLVYFTVMLNNVRISNFCKELIKTIKKRTAKVRPLSIESGKIDAELVNCTIHKEPIKEEPKEEEEEETLIAFPKGHWAKKILFIYSWPIRAIMFCTIPDCKRYPRIFPITFLLCIFWIGTNSYIISWMITLIGNSFSIPDSVLGLTFLAAGGCLPEAISITIMSRKGQGSMGVSNSLGANTLNILLSLGMPWFIKTILLGATEDAYIKIESGSIEYTILALILVAITLYLTLYYKKFCLSRTVGAILMSVYSIFLVLAILSELVFFQSRVEQCT